MQEQLPAPLARVGLSGANDGPHLDVLGRSLFDCAWDGLRAYQFQSETQEVGEGYLLNNVVTLNLGGESTWESNLDGRGWEVHHRQHHGIGVIPAQVPYRARERAANDYLIVEVTPDFVSKVLGQSAPRAHLYPVLTGQDPFVSHVMLALGEAARHGGDRSGMTAESLGTALVAHLATIEAHSSRKPTLPSAKLRRVLAYIAEHLDAPLTLQRLADIADMDFFRFVRAFKQATGSSPHRYVVEARIARAKELLLVDGLSITEIALQTGFATPSHFSVTFRRLTNQTPREYRSEHA